MKAGALLAVAAAFAATPCAGLHAEPAPAPRCKYVQVARLPLRYVGLALVPGVDGIINDAPATMLVDTGADGAYLTLTAVARHALPLQLGSGHVAGIGGLSRVYTTRLKNLAIGPVRSTVRPELNVVMHTGYAPDYDAIVGASFLLQTDMELDLGEKRLRFFQPLDCEHAVFNIWKQDNTIAVPFEDGPYDRSDNPHFAVLVNGVKLDAAIDSGAALSFMTAAAARRVGIEPGGPGTVRVSDSVGIGAQRSANWRATVQAVQIGGETVKDTDIGILAVTNRIGAELYLGQDFLRAHRVLFAMGQKKLYLSYRGGAIFTRGSGFEPWIRAEADGGNADAAYRLAASYASGAGVAADPAAARAWLEKAAAAGQPHANLQLGRLLLLDGQAGRAADHLRRALDSLPSERFGPLWLYLARLGNGEAALGGRELQARVTALAAETGDEAWPLPLARYYLGQAGEAQVRAAAQAVDRAAGAAGTPAGCAADKLMAALQAAQGHKAQADAQGTRLRAACAAQPGDSAP